MAETGQSRKTHGTDRDARPRKKARTSEEGAAGEQTSVVEQEGTVYLSEGVLVSMVDGQWHRVPNELWAWMPSRITYRRCRECSFQDDCGHQFWCYDPLFVDPPREYEYTAWTRKLLRAAEVEQIWNSPEALAPLSIPPRPGGVRDMATNAERLPPELCERIYRRDDGELARTCRPVCRYWEKQCRPAAFREIHLASERMVLDLVRRLNRDPSWKHIPPLVEEIRLPKHTAETKAPWMHLLDPRWKRYELVIEGPFRGHQTLRSIHLGLPRSLPRSFSRGFTRVLLMDVRFGRFEDTTCLASELPDLEELKLFKVRWDSLPTQVPHRRPRANHNKLRVVSFTKCSVTGVESPSFEFAAWTLVLAVSRPSPLDSLDAIHSLVQAANPGRWPIVTVKRDCEGYVSGLDIGHHLPVFVLRYHFEQSTGKRLLFASLDCTDIRSGLLLWSHLRSAIARLPPSWHLHMLFGFSNRKDMVHSVADAMSSLVGPVEVRFAMSQNEAWEDDEFKKKYWYEATLDSEELEGKGVKGFMDVYADWQKIFKLPKQLQNSTQYDTV